MEKIVKRSVVAIGVLLVLNGLINISDDAMVLTYDITSILAGAGFILVGLLCSSSNNKQMK